MEKAYNRETQIFAGKLLYVMAGSVSKEVSALATWFVAAAGALLAVAASNAASLGGYLQVGHLSGSIKLFLAAAAINVVQRWLGAMIAGAVSVDGELAKRMPDVSVDLGGAVELAKEASFPPARGAMARAQKSILAGDLIYGARRVARLSQIQSVLMLPQFALLGWAAWRLLL